MSIMAEDGELSGRVRRLRQGKKPESRFTFTTRTATLKDAAALCALSAQVGYSLQQADVIERLQLIEKHQAGMVLAAVGENGRVLGWLHVAPHYSLGAPPQAQILALVVDVQARGASIGTTLMGAAEVWARGHNLGEMQVSSSLVREDADHFYCGRGYHHLREQQLFRKTLEEMRY